LHKIFAKTLFLGKKVVFLPQCHSTNDHLAHLARESKEPEGSTLYTDQQTDGKGQRGNVWVSEQGKNILLSILLRPKFLALQRQHYLNLITGLALIDVLNQHMSNVSLKWPNDVYVGDKKIAGILIENNSRGNAIESSIIGVGLNVNQKGFILPKATSLFMETEREYDRDEIIESLLIQLEKWYLKLKAGQFDIILKAYHNVLMWRGEHRLFRAQDEEFYGEIVGIDINGKLAINHNEQLRYFGIKEVEFVG